nr:MAG TPA: hypothetical protein [Caudoviricetes sp.]
MKPINQTSIRNPLSSTGLIAGAYFISALKLITYMIIPIPV